MSVPMPMTAHPSLTSWVHGVRALLAEGRRAIVLPVIPRMRAIYGKPEALVPEPAIKTVLLTVKRAAGPAPFIGDPRHQRAMYTWNVATDEYGRHIAGEATLQWSPR